MNQETQQSNALAIFNDSSRPLSPVSVTRPVIQWDYDGLSKAIAEAVRRYDIVVTEDTVKDASAMATELNKANGALHEQALRIQKEAMEPIEEFKEQVLSLRRQIKDARQRIVAQIDVFKGSDAREKREILTGLLNKHLDILLSRFEIPDELRPDFTYMLEKAPSNWLTAMGNLTLAATYELELLVAKAKARQSRDITRLAEIDQINLEHLDKHHKITPEDVKDLLPLEDIEWNVGIRRLVTYHVHMYQTQLRREKEVKEKAEQEERNRIEQEQMEITSRAKQEELSAAQAAVPEDTENPQLKSEENARDYATLTCQITAVFVPDMRIPANITQSKMDIIRKRIEGAVKRKLEAAGFTTLESIIVNFVKKD